MDLSYLDLISLKPLAAIMRGQSHKRCDAFSGWHAGQKWDRVHEGLVQLDIIANKQTDGL